MIPTTQKTFGEHFLEADLTVVHLSALIWDLHVTVISVTSIMLQ